MDGGDSWARISANSNFPEGPDAGRIGLSYHSATGTLFALVDNQAPREAQPEAEDEGLTAMDFVEMDKAVDDLIVSLSKPDDASHREVVFDTEERRVSASGMDSATRETCLANASAPRV